MATNVKELMRDAIQHHQNNNLIAAKEIYDDVIKTNPYHTLALHNILLIHFTLRNYIKAEVVVKKLSKLPLNNKQVFTTTIDILLKFNLLEHLSSTLENSKFRPPQQLSEKINTKILASSLNPSIYHQIQLLINQRQIKRAQALCYSELENRGRSPRLLNMLGTCFVIEKNYNEALKCFQNALNEKINYGEAYYNIAQVYILNDQYEASLEFLQLAINSKENYIPAYKSYLEALELTNKIEEMGELLSSIHSSLLETDQYLKYFQGQYNFRKGNYDHAARHLSSVKSTAKYPLNIVTHTLLGKTYDKLGRYHDAYIEFCDANKLVEKSKVCIDLLPNEYLKNLTRLNETLESTHYSLSNTSVNFDGSPVFLIGFPRSGTTLLDTILNAHPGVAVLEEKPMLHKVITQTDSFDINAILSLSSSKIQYLQDIYFKELTKFATESAEKIIIDKLPLNINHLPIILRLFPNAKIILAMRHPYDSILSCWMQNFQLNQPMANFTSIGRISRVYDLSFKIMEHSIRLFSPDIHVLKYENLIKDFKTEVTEIFKFLDLAWDEDVINYREKTAERGRIKTPSYTQVIKPINTDAKDRWVKYYEFIKTDLMQVRHWVRKWGYGDILN